MSQSSQFDARQLGLGSVWKSQLEASEHISSEQQKECDQQRLEAVIAHYRDRDVRIAHEERKNGQQHGEEEYRS